MLVRIDDDGALVIGQLSHAWLSGQLAREWGNERICAAHPREEIALGAEQHDIGWAAFDPKPRLDPHSGLPASFLQSSVEEHLAVWRDAPQRLVSQSALAALAVSLHGRSLSQLRARNTPEDAPALQAHIDDEAERQRRLCSLLEVSSTQAQRIQRQMWAWDGISLALCNGWRPFTAKAVPSADGLLDIDLRDGAGGAVVLDPWPFASARIQVRCEGRRLRKRYDDQAAMRQALEQAPPLTLTFELVAP